MIDLGYDEHTVIMYLYKLLGHKSINETKYYLHFTDYDCNKVIDNNSVISKSLYEGVDLDE